MPEVLRLKLGVSESRKYLVTTVDQTKRITKTWLLEIQLENVTTLGLPEVDDHYNIWRVPVLPLESIVYGK